MVLKKFINHAYIYEENSGNKYALWYGEDNYFNGYGFKTNSSPDPKGYIPICKSCDPKEGQTQNDLLKCLEEKYSDYPSPSKYYFFGQNCNTFTATSAKCCKDSSPTGLGGVMHHLINGTGNEIGKILFFIPKFYTFNYIFNYDS